MTKKKPEATPWLSHDQVCMFGNWGLYDKL